MLDDFAGADFGDRRVTKRLLRIVEGLAPDPAASFPEAARTEAATEGTYRFLQNADVTPQRILAPHVEATIRRAEKASRVVIAHDTTEFSFSTQRQGLGRINDSGRGFFAHFALAMEVSNQGKRRPLGVLGLETLTRTEPPRSNHHSERIPEEERESYRWKQLARKVGDALAGRVSAVHVMDSEADAFGLLAHMVERGDRFVVRVHHQHRKVTDEHGAEGKLSETLAAKARRFTREVTLAARTAPHRAAAGRRRNLERATRRVTLEFAAAPLVLERPDTERNSAASLKLNVVHVREVNPPAGEEPVDWKLLTSEPISDTAELEAIVDMYRARWTIEEFFKALKTGCAFEKRQLESLRALLNALAVLTPIACNLLLLRNLAREEPDGPATSVLTATEIFVLQRHKSTLLQEAPSVREAMLAIARLGGHLRSNGDPGWIVLGRGYERLLALAEGAEIARRYDQS